MDNMEQELTPAYPYPLRSSEIINRINLSSLTPEVTLSDGERKGLFDFEQPLFEQLKALKDISVSGHIIYPAAFTTEKGKSLFQATYLDTGLEQKIKDKAQSLGLNWDDEREQRAACEQFFDELEKDIETVSEGPRLGEVDEENIKLLFSEADLTKIPERIRERLGIWSAKWAKKEFKRRFLEAAGKLEDLPNPARISRAVELEDFKKKEEGLRRLKKDIKGIKSSRETGLPLEKAEVEVCNLYLRYINVLIASLYPYKKIESGITPRSMERIDHFLSGVGLQFGENGLLQTIPEHLANYAKKRLAEMPEISETAEYQKYNSFRLNAPQVKILAEKILDGYGLKEKGWQAVVLERQGGLAVEFDSEKNTREVKIPRSFKSGLARTLPLLAHEIEGHVLRYANKEDTAGGLRIIQELSTGRGSILSEGAAMWMEDATKKEMFGMADPALPYYWLASSIKAKGGSFKDCFYASLQERAKVVHNMTVEELMKDREKFDKEFSKAYSSTLRIFGRFTDLDDTSGYIAISDPLDYLEQELVVEFLMGQNSGDFQKLLFVAGIDLYSVESLAKINLLDLKNVKHPLMFVARDLWPKIKSRLDGGQNLETAIASI